MRARDIPGEPFNRTMLVFPDALDRVGSDTDVQRAIALAGKDVNRGAANHHLTLLDSRLRGNDEQSLRGNCDAPTKVVAGARRAQWHFTSPLKGEVGRGMGSRAR
jgi:hypothetical protein